MIETLGKTQSSIHIHYKTLWYVYKMCQKSIFIYMIKNIQVEAFIYNPRHIQTVLSTKLVDSYTYKGNYNVEQLQNWLIHIHCEWPIIQKCGTYTNWLIHIHSEATTILKWLFKYKICQSYEIRNPKILRAHFAMDGTYFGNGFFMLRWVSLVARLQNT